jgi:galactose mutarotase-like enzyme
MEFTHVYDEQADVDLVRSAAMTLTVRRLGGEAIGLTHHSPRRGPVGLLWRNERLDDPPRFWKSHATLLFPIVGGVHGLRSRTSDGVAVAFKKQHGVARHSRFALLGKAGDREHFALHYLLTADEATLALYPWRFELWASYALYVDRLEQALTVVNRDERSMPFQVGWHPGFNTPFVSGEKAACHLRLTAGQATQLLNDDKCRLTGEKRPVEFRGDFRFTEAELDRTYMFDLAATPPERRMVELLDPDESFGVRLRFPDYPHLGLWSDADAPFICIEPWHGMDDSVEQEPFDRKFGMLLLPPGERKVFRASIEVIERQAAL